MKLVVEDQDLETVQEIARDRYGVIISKEQAKNLIEENEGLAAALYEYSYPEEEFVSAALVDWILENPPGWHWPVCGDTDEYKAGFFTEFEEAALAKGVGLSENWND